MSEIVNNRKVECGRQSLDVSSLPFLSAVLSLSEKAKVTQAACGQWSSYTPSTSQITVVLRSTWAITETPSDLGSILAVALDGSKRNIWKWKVSQLLLNPTIIRFLSFLKLSFPISLKLYGYVNLSALSPKMKGTISAESSCSHTSAQLRSVRLGRVEQSCEYVQRCENTNCPKSPSCKCLS